MTKYDYYAVDMLHNGYEIRRVNCGKTKEQFLSKSNTKWYSYNMGERRRYKSNINNYHWYDSSIHSDWSVFHTRNKVIPIVESEIDRYLMLGQLKK